MNERWVCKRCFADNDESAGACHRCGLIRGAEATVDDQSAWAAMSQPQAGSQGGGGLLRFWWIPVGIVALIAAGGIWYVTTAQRGDDGALTSAGSLSVTDLRVGDCFNAGEFSEGDDVEVFEVDGVPCEEPHAYEVFAVADYTGSAYPATDAQFEAAFTQICIPPFEDYVGVPYADSTLWASAITPTEEGWDAGDREFICHLHEESSTAVTGSQRGANR